jgi:hypothetical protein
MSEPSISDEAVIKATGKKLADWFAVLDKADATKLPHKAMAELLHVEHNVPGWWRQMITVEYERARGLRKMHETTQGFSANASKTLDVPVDKLFDAFAAMDLPIEVTTSTKPKSIHGKAPNNTRVDVGFGPKGPHKSMVAVAHNKLSGEAEVAKQKAYWKEQLEKLAKNLA